MISGIEVTFYVGKTDNRESISVLQTIDNKVMVAFHQRSTNIILTGEESSLLAEALTLIRHYNVKD